uniref:Uncharacterized protein n=1 Tax=Oryza glumipatula TaxID=40148 RepID=A0A0E0A2N5_9ORYZ
MLRKQQDQDELARDGWGSAAGGGGGGRGCAHQDGCGGSSRTNDEAALLASLAVAGWNGDRRRRVGRQGQTQEG